ncbi:MAG: hypothetical protein PUG68_05105 [Lachnospiraceae bacterium]|nr:hypothetical protein [Lachnospiraceae bacterium]MDY2759030.1 hypothetical protein [Lachnospiraceae bacterium]
MALSFRTTGINKSTRNRIILLVVIFLASLVFFYLILNHHSNPQTSEMSKPTLPTVSITTEGHSQLSLSGYRDRMAVSDIDDFVLPVGSDRKLSAQISTYGASVSKISYEIRSVEEGRMVSSEKVSDLSSKGDTVTFDTQLTNLLSADQTYVLVIRLRSDGDDVWYYTPLMLTANSHVGDMIDFMQDFHEKSLSDDNSSIGKYLETDTSQAAEESSDLTRVDIRSQIGDIALEGLTHKVTSSPVIRVTDIQDDTMTADLIYTIRIEKADYLARETYRVRYGSPRMYLLSYRRTLDVIPSKSTFSVKKNVLSVGVASTDMNTVTNEAGSVAGFVQAGNLYEYIQNKTQITRIFSFGDDFSEDARIRNQDHEIRILNVDAAGSMDFAVYGYMNAGQHEGHNGVDLYHYDSATGIASEEGFIESRHSLAYIRENFSELLYRTPGGLLYLMQNGRLLSIDLSSGEADVLLKNIQHEQYSVSEDSRYIAWTKSTEPSDEIKVRDLASGKTFSIKPDGGDRLRVMCFMEDNLVYGTCHSASDEYMYKLTIMSFKNDRLTKLKDYEKNNIYIKSVTSDENAVKLERVRKDGDTYMAASSDTILNTLDTTKDIGASYGTDSTMGRIRTITLASVSDDAAQKLRFADSRMVMTSSVISIDLYNK